MLKASVIFELKSSSTHAFTHGSITEITGSTASFNAHRWSKIQSLSGEGTYRSIISKGNAVGMVNELNAQDDLGQPPAFPACLTNPRFC
jgi:hypothetical protein